MSRDIHDVHALLTISVKWKTPDQELDDEKVEDSSRTCEINTRPDVIWIFFSLLKTNDAYRHSAIRHWTLDRKVRTHLVLCPSASASNRLDQRGCGLAASLLWRVIEQEDALHWLSTLGGAFSNLGEANQHFAQVTLASHWSDHVTRILASFRERDTTPSSSWWWPEAAATCPWWRGVSCSLPTARSSSGG